MSSIVINSENYAEGEELIGRDQENYHIESCPEANIYLVRSESDSRRRGGG